MEWLLLALQVLPSLVSLAEGVFGPKTGVQKKEAVLSALPALAQGMQAVTTGGANETWKAVNANMDKIAPLVDRVANLVCPPTAEEMTHGG